MKQEVFEKPNLKLALISVLKEKDIDALKVLLALDKSLASVHINNVMETALVWSSENRWADGFTLLIKRGADSNTGLITSANTGWLDGIKLSIENGADSLQSALDRVREALCNIPKRNVCVNGETCLLTGAGYDEASNQFLSTEQMQTRETNLRECKEELEKRVKAQSAATSARLIPLQRRENKLNELIV